MKGMKIVTGIIIGCMALTLAGCGKTALDANDLAMQETVQAQENKCWDAQKPVYTGLPHQTIALLEMSRNNNIAIMTVLDKSPCSKVTAFDVQIVEVQEKNKVAGKAVGVGGDIIKMGLGVYGAVEIADSIADSAGIKVTGDGNIVNTATDQAQIGGSSVFNDKSGSLNNKSNVDSTFTDEENSRNITETVEENSHNTTETVEENSHNTTETVVSE